MQASWTSPFSNRLLLESGYSAFYTDNGDPRPYGVLTDFIPVTEQSTGAGVPFANFIYRGFNPAPSSNQKHATWRGAMSYVTGQPQHEVGLPGRVHVEQRTRPTSAGRSATGSTTACRISCRSAWERTRPATASSTTAVYVQDQWTRKRLTLQGALRYETASSWAPAGENGILADNEFGGPFLLPRTDGVQGYHDITPRMGAAYDVFGNGKTALKVNVGQYLQGAWTGDAYTINNAGSTLVTTINRSWSDPNGNRVAECDFMNPAANGECGAWSALNWGSFNQTTTVNPGCPRGLGHAQSRLAVRRQRAAGNRAADRAGGQLQPAGVEQLLRHPQPRAHGRGLRRGHAHRALESDCCPTAAATRSRSSPATRGAPLAPPTRTTRPPTTSVTRRTTGTAWTCRSTRGCGGAWCVQGGTSTGRGVNDTCDMLTARFGRPMAPTLGTAAVPVIAAGIVDGQAQLRRRGALADQRPRARLLHRAQGGRPRQRHLPLASQCAARRRTSGTNGASRSATYRMTAAQFLAATGRPLATGLATQDVDLLLPGAVYGDRINVVDMRFAKVLRFGKYKSERGSGPLQPVQQQHADDVRDGVRPGDERGAMDAADGRAAAAVHAVQRAVGFLEATETAEGTGQHGGTEQRRAFFRKDLRYTVAPC